MDHSGNNRWEDNSTTYSEEQVEAVLSAIGLYVEGSTWSEFLLHCPVHGGRDTPSFAVQKNSGIYFCFNPSCNETGTLVQLVKYVMKCSDFEAARLIKRDGKAPVSSTADKLKKALEKKVDYVPFSQVVLDKAAEEFWNTQSALQYMKSRSFEEDTLKKFGIGYSAKKDLVMVPMHAPDGMPVGVIGRRPSHTDKVFKNSRGLPTSKTLFNYNRARKEDDTLIVVEASFSAMRVDQSGYPNVAALLMGHLSAEHAALIDRSFRRIVILTDMDKKKFVENCRKCQKAGSNLCKGHNPGRDLGRTIEKTFTNKQILWGSYEPKVIYPDNAKDPDDCTDEVIRQCIKNAVPTMEYNRWAIA